MYDTVKGSDWLGNLPPPCKLQLLFGHYLALIDLEFLFFSFLV